MTHSKRTRGGVTLVELLIVLAIITLLVVLVTAGAQRARVSAQVGASEVIVKKLQQALDHERERIVSQVQKDGTSGYEFKQLLAFAGDDPDRTQALLCYARLRQAFPQTAAEVNAPSFTLGSVTFYRPKHFDPLVGIDPSPYLGPNTNTNDPNHVSAALLYAFASRSGLFTDEATQGAVTQIQLYTLSGGTIDVNVYKDAFGRPIGFYRFGTNTELNDFAAGYLNPKPGASSKDPFDPVSKLYNGGQEWVTGLNNRALAQQVLFVQNNTDPANATIFSTVNRIPVAYSAGPDKQYGVQGQGLVPTSDDILGYRLRKVGQKGGPVQ